MIRIGIAGIHGRMGREIQRLANEDSELDLVVGLVRTATPPDPSASPPIVHDLRESPTRPDVLVVFSQEVLVHAQAAADLGIALVIGTTGLPESELRDLQSLSARVPIWYARNMSFGINIIHSMVQKLAEMLPDADVEIVETHHRGKVDAPSGTALDLAQTIQSARGEGDIITGRSGHAPRSDREIGVQSVRAGVATGQHDILFATSEEEILISHRALNRSVFASGAIHAVKQVASASPGWYGSGVLLSGQE